MATLIPSDPCLDWKEVRAKRLLGRETPKTPVAMEYPKREGAAYLRCSDGRNPKHQQIAVRCVCVSTGMAMVGSMRMINNRSAAGVLEQ